MNTSIGFNTSSNNNKRHTHTHTYIYIYVCVCVSIVWDVGVSLLTNLEHEGAQTCKARLDVLAIRSWECSDAHEGMHYSSSSELNDSLAAAAAAAAAVAAVATMATRRRQGYWQGAHAGSPASETRRWCCVQLPR